MQTKMLINGKLIIGDGDATPVINPATGETIAQVRSASHEQIEAAVTAADNAFNHWRHTTPSERATALLAIADAMEKHQEELADLESVNCGKPFLHALEEEMPLTIDTFRFMAGAARTQTGSAAGEYVAGHTSMIRKEPIGVVASIAPWNYPLMMGAWKLAAPIAAGCCVILKPSTLTPLSTLRLAEILNDILPAGVINVIHGTGGDVGNHLINHPLVECISVTGSPTTGMTVLKAAATNIKHSHLELGGKAPVIVFADADIDAVVSTIRGGGYFNAGQDCAQPCRILAEKSIYERLTADLSNAVSTIKCGGPRDLGVEMGPLISAEQRLKVDGFVQRAQEKAEVTTGGKFGIGDGFFYSPTVIANVDNDAEIATQEVFGPVVSVSCFTQPEEALRIVNASRYGLASSVWTHDVGLAMKMSSRMRYGFTWVNTHGVATPEMPWAAMKGSGTGCDMSVYALDAYTSIRHVMVAH